AITALRAARALAERPEAASAMARPADVAAAGDKEDPVEAAQRYARLVISEIKQYHENAVVAGRKERDLMARLGGEVARARVLYDQRVPADVRRRHDDFEDELVKTLAGGDASLVKIRGEIKGSGRAVLLDNGRRSDERVKKSFVSCAAIILMLALGVSAQRPDAQNNDVGAIQSAALLLAPTNHPRIPGDLN